MAQRDHALTITALAGAAAAPTLWRKRFGLRSAAEVMVALSVLLVVIFCLREQSTSVFLCFALFGVLGWGAASRMDRTSARVFSVVYGFGTIAAIVIYFSYENNYGVPYLMGGSDDLNFEETGRTIARELGIFEYGSIRGNIVTFWHNSVGYLYLMSLLCRLSELLGGFHTMVPRLFNVLCLGLLSVGVYRLSLRVALRADLAVAAALFAGLLPLMVYSSVHSYRDIFIAMVLVWLATLWSPAAAPPKRLALLLHLLVSLAACVVLFEFRKGQSFVAALIVFAGFVFRGGAPKRTVRVLFMAGSLLLVVGAYLFSTAFINSSVLRFIEQAGEYSEYRTQLSGGLSSVVFNTPAPLGSILRIAYALVSPLPILSDKLHEQWVSLGTVLHFFFVPYLFAGVYIAARDLRRSVLLASFTLLFTGMAFFTFQARHIAQYLPFAAVLAAIGYERYSHLRYRVCFCGAGLGLLLMIVYLLLK